MVALVTNTAPDADGPEAVSARPRILVADDEAAIRVLLQVNLAFSGFEVIEAANARDALEQTTRGDVDLALLDVMMPDLSGHDVARRLKEDPATARVPVVFLSARASREDLRLGYELGAVDYVTKPFDPISIGDRIAAALERVSNGTAEALRLERLAELERA